MSPVIVTAKWGDHHEAALVVIDDDGSWAWVDTPTGEFLEVPPMPATHRRALGSDHAAASISCSDLHHALGLEAVAFAGAIVAEILSEQALGSQGGPCPEA
jgi:hypothetical protein